MDFLTSKEINGFKSDVAELSVILDGQKYIFESELTNGLGESMVKNLKDKKNNPRKKPGLFKRILNVL